MELRKSKNIHPSMKITLAILFEKVPFIPQVENHTDAQNFDEIYSNEEARTPHISKKNTEIIKKKINVDLMIFFKLN